MTEFTMRVLTTALSQRPNEPTKKSQLTLGFCCLRVYYIFIQIFWVQNRLCQISGNTLCT